MKELVEVLVGKGLATNSINNICLVVKLVKASAMDQNGDELYPTKWNSEFIDAPVVDAPNVGNVPSPSKQAEAITE